MSQILPITVIFAILLFVLKEILEAVKKANERKRKIKAMKALLAEEIELNHWVWKTLQSMMAKVEGEISESEATRFFIRRSNAGAERFECLRPDNSFWGQGFPAIKDDRYQKLAIDIASADAEFYRLASRCYSAISDLRHFRNGVYSYLDEEGDEKGFRNGYISYVKDGLPAVYDSMNTLYVYCVGKKLELHRMR
jgi:hypothetical protein